MKIDKLSIPVLHRVIDGEAKHVAEITLASDEQVTFCAPTGAEYDVAAKDWGLYATPSLGGRLPRFGLRAALVRSREGLHLMLVEAGKEADFESDMAAAGICVHAWLDNGVGVVAGERTL